MTAIVMKVMGAILVAVFDVCAWTLNRYQLKEPW